MKGIKKISKFILSTMLLVSIFTFSAGFSQATQNHVEKDYIIIQKGDTLYSLAKKYGTTVDQLKEENELTSNMIYVGQKLIIADLEKETPVYRVMAGSFTKKMYAEKRVEFLKKHEIEAIIVQKEINNKLYYRVQAGAFSKIENAVKQKKTVKMHGIWDAYILPPDTLKKY